MAIPDLRSALVILRDYLRQELANPDYANQFVQYGGVDVVLLDEEPNESERAGRPYILLSGVDADAPAWGRQYRQATILAPAKASQGGGGLYGVENPVPAQSLLSQALVAIVRDGRADLIQLGLEGSGITEGRESQASANSEAPLEMTKDHTITCFYSRE